DARKRDGIAFGQEARGFEPQDQILARQHLADARTHFRVGGHRAGRGTPRRQVVGQGEIDRRFAVGPGDDIGLPEGGVLEFLADGRLGVLAFVLEIGELIRTLVLRDLHGLVARVAGEVVRSRKVRLHGVGPRAVKRAADVTRIFRPDAVDGLINYAQTDFGPGGGRAVGVAREDGV